MDKILLRVALIVLRKLMAKFSSMEEEWAKIAASLIEMLLPFIEGVSVEMEEGNTFEGGVKAIDEVMSGEIP